MARPTDPERADQEPTPRAGRQLPRLGLLLGLFLLGAVAALFAASRRSEFERRWDELDDFEPPEPHEPEKRPEPPVPTIEREVTGPAGTLYVDDGGVEEGLPVVFVHGLGGSARQWREQLRHLRRGRRAVAFDLRGHGDSARSAGGGYSLGDFAADLDAVVGELGLERFVLVGHSLGATVAIDYAGRHPDRVAGLLLVDPNGDQTEIPRNELDAFLEAVDEDPVHEMTWYFRQILVGSEPEVADQVLADLELADPAAFHASLESAFAYSPLPALERYESPRLTVTSDMNDLPYSLHRLVDLPHKLIPKTSHWLMMDRPDLFNQAMDDFLAGLDDA